MSSVFVVDSNTQPLDPVHPGRARLLLTQRKAAMFRRYPFTIILKEVKPEATPAPLRVKIDPGSKATGLAVVNDTTGEVVWAAELTHRGHQVKEALDTRRAQRRGRRHRHTRYRMCLPDAYGFPRTKGKGTSLVHGFRTGDMAKAKIPTGTKVGTYVGRVAVRETGSFTITTAQGTIQGLNARYFTVIHRMDGYSYQKGRSA